MLLLALPIPTFFWTPLHAWLADTPDLTCLFVPLKATLVANLLFLCLWDRSLRTKNYCLPRFITFHSQRLIIFAPDFRLSLITLAFQSFCPLKFSSFLTFCSPFYMLAYIFHTFLFDFLRLFSNYLLCLGLKHGIH